MAILIPETERVLICRSTTNKRRMVWNWIEHNNLRFIACNFISNMQNLRLPNKIRRLYSRNMGAQPLDDDKIASILQRHRLFLCGYGWWLTCDDKQDSLVLGPLIMILKSTFEAELQLFFVDNQLIIHFSPNETKSKTSFGGIWLMTKFVIHVPLITDLEGSCWGWIAIASFIKIFFQS